VNYIPCVLIKFTELFKFYFQAPYDIQHKFLTVNYEAMDIMLHSSRYKEIGEVP